MLKWEPDVETVFPNHNEETDVSVTHSWNNKISTENKWNRQRKKSIAPNQHIRRQPSPSWHEYSEKWHLAGYPENSKINPQPYKFLNISFVTSDDLLELFLSLTGAAPLDATLKKNSIYRWLITSDFSSFWESKRRVSTKDFHTLKTPPLLKTTNITLEWEPGVEKVFHNYK